MSGSSGIRIVTINTWKGDGPYEARLQALAEGLKAERPDILALQESLITVDGRYDTAEFLASELGMQAHCTRTRHKVRDVEGKEFDSWSGPATLARWPISNCLETELPADPRDGQRVALSCTINTPRSELRFVNLHLTHLMDRDDLRRTQLETALDGADIDSQRATIVCGDFNSLPESPAITWLKSGPFVSRVVDASTAPLITMSSSNPYVDMPGVDVQIDYIFGIGGERAPGNIAFRDTRVVLNSPSTGGAYPSDHFGIATTALI